MPTTHGRRQFLQTVGTAGAVLAGGVGVAGAREGASGDDTIVDVAASNDSFDSLVAAVQQVGLVDDLSGNRQLTVFAPTDAAFQALLAATPYDSLDDIPVGTLRAILLYHVTPGRRYAASVVRAPQVPTLRGSAIDVDGTTLDGGEGSIVATDIEASNGVIHGIDGVLLP